MNATDPATAERAAELRARAVRARLAARAVRAATALDLPRRAGPEVWQGPSAAQCLGELLDARRRLESTCDGLLALANRLERTAMQLEQVVVIVR